MNTRFYIPTGKGLPPVRWTPELGDARRLASAMASRGDACLILPVRVSGPDTTVLLELQRHLLDAVENGKSPIPEGEHWQAEEYERHEPTDQLPLPGDGPPLFDTVVVTLHKDPVEAPAEPAPKKKATRKKRSSE